jgi:hypothetical protein
MTYLKLVNAVLSRLREDTVTTVAGNDDVVVSLVRDYINDAKRVVESSYNWSALSAEWQFSTAVGETSVDSTAPLGSVLDVVFDSNGNELRPLVKNEMRKRVLQGQQGGTPFYYSVSGSVNGNYQLSVWPSPDSVRTYHLYGYGHTSDLAQDTDTLLVPSEPVIYLALANAARERGEVGAQGMPEMLGMAQQYLTDAIARDASNNINDNIWTMV